MSLNELKNRIEEKVRSEAQRSLTDKKDRIKEEYNKILMELDKKYEELVKEFKSKLE